MNTTTLEALDTFGKRLKHALRVRDVSQAEMAAVIGVKQQAIFLLCKEKSKGTKHSFSIARYLRVDPEWLILGNGNPPTSIEDDPFESGLLTSQERELLTDFRRLTKAQRDDEIINIHKMAKANKEVVTELAKTLS